MDDAMMLPASDTSLAWVYEGATPAMTPSEAATAIQAATLGWTQDDHLQMGALQHHLAVGLGDDPERQAVCSAAAYMHVAAAGLDPDSLLNKALDPKVLRPKLGAKPEQIGKTRSGKPIYNMFTHPAHASFTTADHVDHIDAMAAHSKAKKMNKAGTPPKLSVVQHAGPKTPGGHPILHSEHPSYAHPIYNHRAKAGTNWGDEEKVKHQTLKDFSHYSAADHDAAHAHHHALGLKQKAAGGEHFQAGLKSSGISAGHQLAASHLRGLQKIKEHPGKSSEWHAGQMGGLRGGNQEHFESHRAASIHLRNMGKSMSGTKGKSGEGSRGGKILRHTAAGAPVYAPSEHNGFSIGKTSSGVPVHHDGSYLDIKSKKEFVDASRLHGAKAAYHRQKAAKIGEGRQGNSKPSSALSAHERLMNEHERHSQQFMNLAKLAKSNAPEGDMYKSEAVSILEDFLSKAYGTSGPLKNFRGDKPTTGSGKVIPLVGSPHYKKVSGAAHSKDYVAGAHRNAPHIAPHFKDWSKQDHLDAAEYHEGDNHHHIAGAHFSLGGYYGNRKTKADPMGKSMSKSGEGSRGGKVIGHLKNGKPVYASRAASHASHERWTPAEHREAGALHNKAASEHANAFVQNMKNKGGVEEGVNAQRNKKKHQAFAESHFAAAEKIIARKQKASNAVDAHMAQRGMSKSGEGSRGGKVIGHTKSGKPIYGAQHYEHLDHAEHGTVNYPKDIAQLKENVKKVLADHKGWSAQDHHDASFHHAELHDAIGQHNDGPTHKFARFAHKHAAYALEKKDGAEKSMAKSGIMGFPVDLGDMQGSPIDGSYVDSMGGSHDLFMQQAELANCPTMWAPIATVPEN